jgi:hypothetical protein
MRVAGIIIFILMRLLAITFCVFHLLFSVFLILLERRLDSSVSHLFLETIIFLSCAVFGLLYFFADLPYRDKLRSSWPYSEKPNLKFVLWLKILCVLASVYPWGFVIYGFITEHYTGYYPYFYLLTWPIGLYLLFCPVFNLLSILSELLVKKVK